MIVFVAYDRLLTRRFPSSQTYNRREGRERRCPEVTYAAQLTRHARFVSRDVEWRIQRKPT